MSITLGTSGSIVLDSGSNLIGQVELSNGTDVIGVPGQALIVDGSAVTQPVSGSISVSNFPSSQAVTGTFWQTTQPVSGTVTADLAANSTITDVPATSGGWSSNIQQALSNSVETVKSSAGQLGGYAIFNPNTATAYVFFYNVSSPTVGSATNLIYQIGIPAGAAANVEFGKGIAFSTGIYVVASASAIGSSAPSTGLVVTSLYK